MGYAYDDPQDTRILGDVSETGLRDAGCRSPAGQIIGRPEQHLCDCGHGRREVVCNQFTSFREAPKVFSTSRDAPNLCCISRTCNKLPASGCHIDGVSVQQLEALGHSSTWRT